MPPESWPHSLDLGGGGVPPVSLQVVVWHRSVVDTRDVLGRK